MTTDKRSHCERCMPIDADMDFGETPQCTNPACPCHSLPTGELVVGSSAIHPDTIAHTGETQKVPEGTLSVRGVRPLSTGTIAPKPHIYPGDIISTEESWKDEMHEMMDQLRDFIYKKLQAVKEERDTFWKAYCAKHEEIARKQGYHEGYKKGQVDKAIAHFNDVRMSYDEGFAEAEAAGMKDFCREEDGREKYRQELIGKIETLIFKEVSAGQYSNADRVQTYREFLSLLSKEATTKEE